MTAPDHNGIRNGHIDIIVGDDGVEDRLLGSPAAGRRWLGIQFDCCGVYTRIYKNAEGTAYVGYCPRCARHVRLRVGPGGTNSRFFTAR